MSKFDKCMNKVNSYLDKVFSDGFASVYFVFMLLWIIGGFMRLIDGKPFMEYVLLSMCHGLLIQTRLLLVKAYTQIDELSEKLYRNQVNENH